MLCLSLLVVASVRSGDVCARSGRSITSFIQRTQSATNRSLPVDSRSVRYEIRYCLSTTFCSILYVRRCWHFAICSYFSLHVVAIATGHNNDHQQCVESCYERRVDWFVHWLIGLFACSHRSISSRSFHLYLVQMRWSLIFMTILLMCS